MTEKDNKYKTKYAESLPEMFSQGESVAEVCAELGISRQTFYVWCEKYPKFKTAYERGKELSEAWWCKLGRAGAAGKVNIQSATWIFNMKNKFGWRDQPAKEPHESDINVNIDLRSSDEIMKDRGIPIPSIDVPDMDDEMADIYIPEIDEEKVEQEKRKPDTKALIQSLEKLKGKAIDNKMSENKKADDKSPYKNLDNQEVSSPFGEGH